MLLLYLLTTYSSIQCYNYQVFTDCVCPLNVNPDKKNFFNNYDTQLLNTTLSYKIYDVSSWSSYILNIGYFTTQQA